MPHANWGNVELYAYRGEHYLVVELFKEGPFNQFDDRAITDTIVYGGVKNEIVTGKTRAGQEEGKVGVIYKDDASCLICYGFENHHHCFTTQARATLKSTEGKILARRVFDYQESENGPLKQWRSKHPGAREGNLIDLMRVYRQVIKEELWGEIQD